MTRLTYLFVVFVLCSINHLGLASNANNQLYKEGIRLYVQQTVKGKLARAANTYYYNADKSKIETLTAKWQLTIQTPQPISSNIEIDSTELDTDFGYFGWDSKHNIGCYYEPNMLGTIYSYQCLQITDEATKVSTHYLFNINGNTINGKYHVGTVNDYIDKLNANQLYNFTGNNSAVSTTQTPLPDTTQDNWTSGLTGSGKVTTATFLVQITADAGKTYASNFDASQKVDIAGKIRPAPEHVGKNGVIYIVVRYNNNWYMKTPQGWVVWDATGANLKPASAAHSLSSIDVFDVEKQMTGLVGEFAIYVGYKVDSDVHYNAQPFRFTVTDIKQVGMLSMTPNSVVLTDQQIAQIITINQTDDRTLQIRTAANSEISKTLVVGNVMVILPGQDARYPFGLTAKITNTSKAKASDGSTIISLIPAALLDILEDVKDAADVNFSVPLNNGNFMGVISPSASVNSMSTSGAFNLKIPLSKLNFNLQPTVDRPYGVQLEKAALSINGNVDNLKLTYKHNLYAGNVDMRLTGDLNIAANFSGDFEAELGNYSQAWNEVNAQQLNVFGFNGKFTGLDSKDKIGQFPLVGLVFSIPCPETCPILPGKTQTPLRSAKMGGVIVWIYSTAQGNTTLKGEVGTKVNTNFTLGISKEGYTSPIIPVITYNNPKSGRLIEAPYFKGDMRGKVRLGASIDVDLFLIGVRAANASLFFGTQADIAVKNFYASYVKEKKESLWEWKPEEYSANTDKVCLKANVGSGFILSAALRLALNNVELFDKNMQWPTEEEIQVLGDHGGWYTAEAIDTCPAPTVTSTTCQTEIDNYIKAINVLAEFEKESYLVKFGNDTSAANNCHFYSCLAKDPVYKDKFIALYNKENDMGNAYVACGLKCLQENLGASKQNCTLPIIK